MNTSYGTRFISDSNAFVFDVGVQGSFNPDFSFGSVTVYPALVSGGITLNITAATSSLTFNKILSSNNVSSSDIQNLNTTLRSFLTASNFNTDATNTNPTLSSILSSLSFKVIPQISLNR